MKDIIVVCAGSTAIEVYSLIETINEEAEKNGIEKPYNILGFIEDNPNVKLPDYIEYPILGSIDRKSVV